jgi:glyceraldehyde-3-phosphate dehydrogenase/erythrose-4-phosphate dehydrogenase
MPHITEISFEVPVDEVSVLDGYCQATGKKRTTVIRALLKEWSDQKRHESIMICRVARVNPVAAGSDRESL